ncbi:cytochrome c peroxidase [Humitalea rosea]|uniref:Cytochrome c peroxidase n=1 Tax=Humitalea rosea TaxID=990373 RepID=A0A2W7JAD1_9PROT|nr:cytochrome c peroxidase [Humitalea rosea]
MPSAFRRARLPLVAVLALLSQGAAGDGPLPPGSQIDPPHDRVAAIRMSSELAGGTQSPLVALGGAAFASPLLYGAAAQAAGISCNACHSNGHVNQSFNIPGFSGHGGSFDATSGLFNPRADNHVHDPVDIPSLRGVRFRARFGRDGRFGSLREFARHVIVDEFGGPEPAPLILDALAAWMSELEFVSNPRVGPLGDLAENATPAEHRGEAVFNQPFAGLGGLACSSCHIPSAGFTDGRAHDVGTGGRYLTPTLLNSSSSAPYFHDGSAPDFAAVVTRFDDRFGLGLTEEQRADLRAYLDAIGDGEDVWEPPSFRRDMAELAVWVDLLDSTLRGHEVVLTRFVADTVRHDLQRVARSWPEGDTSNRADRKREPFDPVRLSALLEVLATKAEAGDAEGGLAALNAYYAMAEKMVANYPRGGVTH